MKTLQELETYLKEEQSTQQDAPGIINDALDLLTRVKTPQQYIAELIGMRNFTSDPEAKRWFNAFIDSIQEKQVPSENWETQEVIDVLINDPGEYIEQIKGMSPRELEMWVKQGNAPGQLYESFSHPPVSSFQKVDWDAVVDVVASL